MSEGKDEIGELRNRSALLMHQLLNEAEHILKAGSPQNKITLMKSVIPVLMKELQSSQAADTQAELKASLESMFAGVRSELPTRATIHDLPEDADGSQAGSQ